MQVLKFGGSSVANATNISRVLDIVGAAAKKSRVMLICSAIKGCTDELLALARLAERQQVEALVELAAGKIAAEPDSEALQFAEKVRDLKARHLEIIRRLFTGGGGPAFRSFDCSAGGRCLTLRHGRPGCQSRASRP